jgi:hypothetical protein
MFLFLLPLGCIAGTVLTDDSLQVLTAKSGQHSTGLVHSANNRRMYVNTKTDTVFRNFAGLYAVDLFCGIFTVSYERYLPGSGIGLTLIAAKGISPAENASEYFFDKTPIFYSKLRSSGITLRASKYFPMSSRKVWFRAGFEVGAGQSHHYKFEERSRYSPGGSLMTWYVLVPDGKMPYGIADIEAAVRFMRKKRLTIDLYSALGEQLRREYKSWAAGNEMGMGYTTRYRMYYHGGIMLGLAF